MKPPSHVAITTTQDQHQLPPLPFTTALSSTILRLTHPHHASLIKSSFRYLSLVLIRELAILEDLFIQSPLYRLIRYLTPSILLPTSSTYPFLFTVTLGLIQLKKTWNHQPNLLLNLYISLGPILHTLRALAASDVPHHPHHYPSSSSAEPKDQHSLKRWSIYWLIYCALINLESLNVRVHDQPQPTLLRSRPTIYPSIPQPNHPDHPYNLTEKLSHLFKFFSSRYPRNISLLNLVIPKLIMPSTSKPFTTHGSKAPRIPMESFDIHTPATTRNTSRVPLPQYLFGKDERVYTLFKVIFLRWCSKEDSRVLELIWLGFLSPLAGLIGGGSIDPRSAKLRRRTKVVKVTVSEEEVEGDLGGSHSYDEGGEDAWRSKGVRGGLYQTVDGSKDPIRRIRSDPGTRSPSLPADHVVPTDHNDPILRHHSLSGSQSGSSRRSTNPSTAPDLPELAHFHSPVDSLKISHLHSLVDLKTPENAWDSLSYIG